MVLAVLSMQFLSSRAQHAGGVELRARTDLGRAADLRDDREHPPGLSSAQGQACAVILNRRAPDEEDPQQPRRLRGRDARRPDRRASRILPPARRHQAASSPAPSRARRARSASSPAAGRATCRSSPAMSGPGLLDACAIGDVFASPSAEQMADAIRAADSGAGVLRLYGNYGGDVMNFDMAGDLVEFDGHPLHHRAPGRRRRLRRAGGARRSGAAWPAWSMPSRSRARRPRRAMTSTTVTRRRPEGGRRLPLGRRGALLLHRPAGRQAHLRHRRRRDGDGHGHPWRARRLARQAAPGRRHRRAR